MASFRTLIYLARLAVAGCMELMERPRNIFILLCVPILPRMQRRFQQKNHRVLLSKRSWWWKGNIDKQVLESVVMLQKS